MLTRRSAAGRWRLTSFTAAPPLLSAPSRPASTRSDAASSPLLQASSTPPPASSPAMSASESPSPPSPAPSSSFWRRWTSEPLSHPRYSASWWRDTVLILVVFSITGSLSLLVVRPLLSSALGVSGSLRDGPNSYRLMSLLLVPPTYSVMLLTIGTLVGQHHYFRKVALRMWGRLLPKSWTGANRREAEKMK